MVIAQRHAHVRRLVQVGNALYTFRSGDHGDVGAPGAGRSPLPETLIFRAGLHALVLVRGRARRAQAKPYSLKP